MVNRATPPKIFTDFDIQLDGVFPTQIKKETSLISIPSKGNEIIKVDLIIPIGRVHEINKGLSKVYFSCLMEGCPGITAAAFNEEMDYYGAILGAKGGMDKSTVTLLTLKKHFKKIFPQWIEMIATAHFPADKVQLKKDLLIQKLERQLAKNNVISFRELSANIFGADNSYGYNTTPDHLNQIDSDLLVNFHTKNIISAGTFIVSGDVDDSIIQLIENSIPSNTVKSDQVFQYKSNPFVKEAKHISGPQENQTSVRFGCKLFNKKHPDFLTLEFLNVALGGFFGSRLVSNLREEKGYCYHIDSTLDTMIHDGGMYISADVGSGHVEDTIREIKKELSLLQNERINENELNLIKNYLKGQLLSLLDGPFSKAELVKSYLISGLNYHDFNAFPQFISDVKPEELQKVAQKYLSPDEFSVYVVG